MRRREFVAGNTAQKELPGMPKRTPLGEKVIEYLKAKDEHDRRAGILESLKGEVIQLMITEGKRFIAVDRRTVALSEKSGFKLSVKETD